MSPAATGLRVGDAERAAATERLAWHFSHGRLDQAELEDRLDRAMRASTSADLAELFADLPGDEPAGAAAVIAPRPSWRRSSRRPARARPRRALRWLGLAVLMLAVVAVLARAVTHSLVVWAVLLVVTIVWLGRRRT